MNFEFPTLIYIYTHIYSVGQENVFQNVFTRIFLIYINTCLLIPTFCKIQNTFPFFESMFHTVLKLVFKKESILNSELK